VSGGTQNLEIHSSAWPIRGQSATATVTDEVAEELARIADAQQGNAVSGTVAVDFDQRRIAAAG
jgi:hypothetical protein